jgi:hypothetical protein
MILEELYENEEILQERSRLVFSRRGGIISKKYRCASGKISSSSGKCGFSAFKKFKYKKRLSSKRFRHFIKRNYFDKLRSRRSIDHLLGKM